ncbi:hypothetical protein ACQWG0_25160, partial [Salmonella enterica subsp. enterica serovar Infantis]
PAAKSGPAPTKPAVTTPQTRLTTLKIKTKNNYTTKAHPNFNPKTNFWFAKDKNTKTNKTNNATRAPD